MPACVCSSANCAAFASQESAVPSFLAEASNSLDLVSVPRINNPLSRASSEISFRMRSAPAVARVFAFGYLRAPVPRPATAGSPMRSALGPIPAPTFGNRQTEATNALGLPRLWPSLQLFLASCLAIISHRSPGSYSAGQKLLPVNPANPVNPVSKVPRVPERSFGNHYTHNHRPCVSNQKSPVGASWACRYATKSLPARPT
jgi:hypothetical protein